MTASVRNKTNTVLPMTMAIIGIPSGLSAQPWQLKELQDKKKVSYYEVRGNYVFFYFTEMSPQAEIKIPLDLKAEIPGSFESPASSSYLYYTNEFKSWSGGKRIIVKKD